MENLKVWIVGRGIPVPRNRMLGSFEVEQAVALKKKGVDVVYFAIRLNSERIFSNPGYKKMEIKGIPVYSVDSPLGRLFPLRKRDGVFDFIFNFLAKKAIKKYGFPDIIHVHYPAMRSYRDFGLFQSKGVKIVATEHWSAVQRMKLNEIYRRHLSDFVSNCDAFICVSSCLKQSVLELTGTSNSVHVVPNLVDSMFSSVSHRDTDFKFVVSGRLVPIKQVDKVVSSFIDTFSADDKVRLIIAGGGNMLESIQKDVRSAGREDQISLLGTVLRDRMAEIMSTSDVLIAYSKMETFCVPIIEAWMCGKPVIASDTISVVIDNPDSRLGVVVDPNDNETLKDAMRSVYYNYSKYNSKTIIDYANNHFSEDVVAGKLLDIYFSLLK